MEVQIRSILVSARARVRAVDWHGSYYAGKTSMVSRVMRQNTHSSRPLPILKRWVGRVALSTSSKDAERMILDDDSCKHVKSTFG